MLLFAGNRVSDFAAALAWYERLLGAEPAFFPNETEAVWALDGNGGYLYIDASGPAAGGALNTIMVDDLEGTVSELSSRGIEPAEREEYASGARKAIYRDPDGNEIGFGEAPAGQPKADRSAA